MFLSLLLICFFANIQDISYETPIQTSFIELEDSNKIKDLIGKQMSIRGFLYKTEDGAIILSCAPNLKSCCLAKQNLTLIIQETAIQNESPSIEESNLAMTLTGRFSKQANASKVKYYLLDARIIDQEGSLQYTKNRLIKWGGLLFAISAIGLLIWLKVKHPR